MANHDATQETAESERVAAILRDLTPRMETAKRSYMRRRVAWLLGLPLLMGAGAALAATSQPEPETRVAAAPDFGEPPVDAPFVDATATPTADASGVDGDGELLAKTGTAPETPEWQTVELGFFGSIEVGAGENDKIAIASKELAAGWTAEVVFSQPEQLTLALRSEDETVIVTVTSDDGVYSAEVSALPEPTATPTPEPTPKPTPKPTEKPAQTIETRKEIAVYDIGKVVVERDGDQLWLAIKWSAEGFEPVVLVEHGAKVKAEFVSDNYRKFVKAWIEGTHIKHQVWYEELAPSFQTEKEISVYDKGAVLVQRVGESDVLTLSVLWNHDWWEPAVVTAEGTKVHAYFTNDGVKKHVEAWTEGPYIEHEVWYEEPPVQPYSGEVVCEFGTFSVTVEAGVAHITAVGAAEGVTATVIKETGEIVKVQYDTGAEIWLVKAWGNGTEVVYEAIQTG